MKKVDRLVKATNLINNAQCIAKKLDHLMSEFIIMEKDIWHSFCNKCPLDATITLNKPGIAETSGGCVILWCKVPVPKLEEEKPKEDPDSIIKAIGVNPWLGLYNRKP